MVRALLFFGLLATILSSCGKFQKALKSDNPELKLQVADRFYNEEKYHKALPLYEELVRIMRGDAREATIMYRYANCEYEQGNLIIAGYHFKRFSQSFPYDERAEEASYKNVQCLIMQSPRYSLEQSATKEALERIQLFVNRFPDSKYIPECNRFMDILRAKLEKKRYENAYIYYQILDYKAAITALETFLKDHPASPYKEDAEYYKMAAQYHLAVKSVETKKKDRLREAVKMSKEFELKFPESKHSREAAEFRKKSLHELDKLNNNG